MKKAVILYYSKTGNSKFIADKISVATGYPMKRVKPMLDKIFALYLISLLKLRIPINIGRDDLLNVSQVVLIGPIWGGLLVSPLRAVMRKCIAHHIPVHFAVTCETPEKDKDTKYGFQQVLDTARRYGRGIVKSTAAFSTDLVRSPDEPISLKLSEKTRITEGNFKGLIVNRLESFLSEIRQ